MSSNNPKYTSVQYTKMPHYIQWISQFVSFWLIISLIFTCISWKLFTPIFLKHFLVGLNAYYKLIYICCYLLQSTKIHFFYNCVAQFLFLIVYYSNYCRLSKIIYWGFFNSILLGCYMFWRLHGHMDMFYKPSPLSDGM